MASETKSADTVAAVADRIMDSLDKVGAKIGDAAPVAYKNLVEVTFASGCADLIMGTVYGCLAIAVGIFTTKLVSAAIAEDAKPYSESNEGIVVHGIVGGIVGTVATILFLVAALATIGSETFIKIFSPEGYVTRELVYRAIS